MIMDLLNQKRLFNSKKLSYMNQYELAKSKGWTYNPITGQITGTYGNIIGTRVKQGKRIYIRAEIIYKWKRYHILAHRFAFYIMTGEVPEIIDHIEHGEDPVYNNRWSNLREASHTQNMQNMTGKGYYPEGNKYKSMICVNRKQIYLGLYDTEEQARKAYLDAKEKYHKF